MNGNGHDLRLTKQLLCVEVPVPRRTRTHRCGRRRDRLGAVIARRLHRGADQAVHGQIDRNQVGHDLLVGDHGSEQSLSVRDEESGRSVNVGAPALKKSENLPLHLGLHALHLHMTFESGLVVFGRILGKGASERMWWFPECDAIRQRWANRDRGPHVARHNVFGGPRKHSRKSSNLKYPPTHHSKRKCRDNLNRDLLQFALEGTALRYTQPSESGHRAKLIAHPCYTRLRKSV